MTNQQIEVVTIPFNLNTQRSYEVEAQIELKYGSRLLALEEIRDSRGYLKEFKVTLRAQQSNQFRVQS